MLEVDAAPSHDVRPEIPSAVPPQQAVRCFRGCRAEEEHPSHDGSECKTAFTSETRDLHQGPASKSTWYTKRSNDEGVAVRNVGRSVAERRTPCREKVREERVVERESKSDESPYRGDERC